MISRWRETGEAATGKTEDGLDSKFKRKRRGEEKEKSVGKNEMGF